MVVRSVTGTAGYPVDTAIRFRVGMYVLPNG